MKYHVLLFSLIQISNVTCCHPCSLSPSNCTPFLGRLAANTVTEKFIISFSFSFYFPSSASYSAPPHLLTEKGVVDQLLVVVFVSLVHLHNTIATEGNTRLGNTEKNFQLFLLPCPHSQRAFALWTL